MKALQTPQESLGDLDATTVAGLLGASSDVVLVLDSEGIIIDAAFGNDQQPIDRHGEWLGKPWADVVTTECRHKIEELIRDAANGAIPRWRQVNHPVAGRQDIPVNYLVMQVGDKGHLVAVGRDLQPLAAMQQRLIDVQQSLERDYWQLRQAEARYRLLFQTASEPVLVIDAETRKVLEANPAAGRVIGSRQRELVGQRFPEGFDEQGQTALLSLLDVVSTVGRSEDILAARPDGSVFRVSASLLRRQTEALILLRLVPHATTGDDGPDKLGEAFALSRMMNDAPDALIMTDAQGRVLGVNRTFLDLAELGAESEAVGESLSRWLGRHEVDVEVMLANLRQHAAVHLFPTVLRGALGGTARVEVSASVSGSDTAPRYGFFLRHIEHRPSAESEIELDQPRSVEQMTQLVGQVPLKELVRESTDLIEKLCIEAALQLTGDNRASAAELLGLSRQSLYVKLRRHGLMDLESTSL